MKSCKQCNKEIVRTSPQANNVAYCSKTCRSVFYKLHPSPSHTKAARDESNHARWNKYAPGKLQCPECSGWFRALGHHVAQRHKITARAFKEAQGLDVSKSLVIEDVRQVFRDRALENNMHKRLPIIGKGTRFTKGHGINYTRSPETIARLRAQGQEIAKRQKRKIEIGQSKKCL